MRTWGRDSKGVWVEVATDANGFDDAVWLTTLVQCLLLNLGESPFFGNYGIPAQLSVMTQIHPDFYVMNTQQQFAPYFASLIVSKVASPTPTYNINAVTQQGFPFSEEVQVPR